MLKAFTDFFVQLPETTKAAVVASLVTLLGTFAAAIAAFIGVYVTHRGHEHRFKAQLQSEKDKSKVDREMTLRKEVYLGAAEAIIAGLGVVARHADLSVAQDELAKEFTEKRSAMAKVHLIGGEETLNAVTAFTVELGAAILKLSLGRYPLLQMKSRLKILADQIQAFGQERDRMVQLMKELNFAGNAEAHRWNFVQNTFDFEQKRVSDAIVEQKTLSAQLRDQWLPYTASCYDASARISKLLVPAIKAVRSELGLPFDVTSYEVLVAESMKKQDQALKDFLGSISSIAG